MGIAVFELLISFRDVEWAAPIPVRNRQIIGGNPGVIPGHWMSGDNHGTRGEW
jgi:hypothetical protein